jgi:hypothetical protein
MHEARSLVARLIQPAPENCVGVQGNSLNLVAQSKRPYTREDARVHITIKLDERRPAPQTKRLPVEDSDRIGLAHAGGPVRA